MEKAKTIDYKLRPDGLIFNAISDFKTCELIISAEGIPELAMPNRLQLPVAIEAKLEEAARSYWHPNPSARLPAEPTWVLNTCADAESFFLALKALDMAYPVATPIFNHPRAVMLARRDIACLALTGIPGLEISKCRRFVVQGPQSFIDCFDQGGFQYPVFVHSGTSRNGADRIWVAHPSDWQATYRLIGGGREHVMVQGHFDEATSGPRVRMVFVGGGGTVSLLHNGDKNALEVSIFLKSKAFVESVFKAAHRRIPLDFWTLDVALLAADKMRLLDLSVGFLVPDSDDPLHQLSLRIANDLAPQMLALLAQPSMWRGDARKLPNVASLKDRYGA